VLWSIFSVLVIFWLCWPILIKPHYHATEINRYNKQSKFWSIPKRQIINITLTGDTILDKANMAIGWAYVRGILRTKDTVHAVDFHFGARSKYAEFVEVLDICNMEDAKTYTASDEGIEIFYIPEKPWKGRKFIRPMPL